MLLFILALCLTNYHANLRWGTLIGFVVRVAMVDDGRCPLKIFTASRNYSIKLLGIVWIWSCFIIIQAYSGHLTAMITRPILEKQINSIEDLISQNNLMWNLNRGTEIYDYLKASESLRPLYDRAIKPSETDWDDEDMEYYCWSKEEMDSGTFVSICDHYSILNDNSMDFSENGKCNFYTIMETFFTTPSAIALQVVS